MSDQLAMIFILAFIAVGLLLYIGLSQVSNAVRRLRVER